MEDFDTLRHRLLIEELDKNGETLKRIEELEAISRKYAECWGCRAMFKRETKTRYCQECKDKRTNASYARSRKKNLVGYWKKKLGYIPEEKQDLVDFLDSIIKEGESLTVFRE